MAFQRYRRTTLCLFVIAIGICTFFVPLITVDPPVAGTAHWSEWQIVQHMYEGKLPNPTCERCGEPVVRSLVALPVTVTVIYVLMLSTVIPLSVPYASATLTGISGVGAVISLSLWRFGTRWAFEETFYGSAFRLGHVHYGLLQVALFSIMSALCLISLIYGSDRPSRKLPSAS
jgi:hypothetical protein